MKKNVVLLVMAITLGVFTYTYQEVGDKKKKESKELESRILNFTEFGEVKTIILPNIRIHLSENGYSMEGVEEAPSADRVEEFLGILSHIKVKRVLESANDFKREDYIPAESKTMTFEFANGRASFTLGQKIEFDRSFYLELEKTLNGKTQKSIVVAFDSDHIDTVYEQGEAHRTDLYYRRFQALYYLKPEFFLDHRIFGPWMTSKWSLRSVVVDNRRNNKFRLDLTGRVTKPAPPKFLQMSLTKMKGYEKEMAYLTAQELFTNFNTDLFNEENKVADIKVTSTKGISEFQLFHNLSREFPDFYIHKDSKVYKIGEREAQLFMGSAQSFWDLTVIRTIPKNMTLTFGADQYKVDFTVDQKGLFTAKSDKGEAKHMAFQQLIKFLGQPALYYTEGVELLQFYDKQLSLDWGAGEFFLMMRSGEVLLYHKETMQALVYKIQGQVPFSVSKKEYFDE